MKKIIITTLFIVLYIVSFSQEKIWINKNYFGLHIGGVESSINLIYIDTEKAFKIEDPSVTSITAGLSFKNFSEQIGALSVGVSTDLNYIQKGGYLGFNLGIDSLKTENVLLKYVPSYIELVPLVNLSIGKKRIHFNILAGPHFSYIIKEELIFLSEINSVYKQHADNKFEFGLDVGGGIDFDFGRSNIELRFLYGFGFTDIFNADEINVDLWYNQNRAMSGLLYYYYKL